VSFTDLTDQNDLVHDWFSLQWPVTPKTSTA